MSMTQGESKRLAIPHQGIRTLSSHACFSSPRGKMLTKQNRREKEHLRRLRHGVARAIEDLRRVRMSLVPLPNTGKRLLQRM